MTVFILGAGVMQIPAIESARELGWYSVVADGNPRAAGASLADRFLHVDLKDLSGLEAAARAVRAERGLDAVFTAGTDFSASVAWVASRLGLPGIPHEVALAASDKPRMRAVFEAAGVPSPRFLAVMDGQDPSVAAEGAGLPLPLVVKPADSMGARGCRLARSRRDLEEAVHDALPHSRSGRAIVEEYMDGPEFSIDAIVVDGEIRIRGFADRHIFFAPYFVELGHTMPSAFGREIRDEVLRVFAAGVRALGITRGAAKGDMKWCPSREGAMVGEIAARLSGGYMSGWTYPYASGIEVTREGLLVAAGIHPGAAPADRGWVSAERAFISMPGRVKLVHGLREAAAMPYVKNLFSRVAPGDSCVFPSNNVEKCGNVIAQAPDRQTAIAAAEAAVRSILVRLEPGRPETEAFLEGQMEGALLDENGSAWPPLAFSPSGILAEALAALPDWASLPMDGDLSEALSLAVLSKAGAADCPDRDWAGRCLLESAELAVSLAAGPLSAAAASQGSPFRIPVRRFWNAVVRGGAQGGLYALDCAATGGEGA